MDIPFKYTSNFFILRLQMAQINVEYIERKQPVIRMIDMHLNFFFRKSDLINWAYKKQNTHKEHGLLSK